MAVSTDRFNSIHLIIAALILGLSLIVAAYIFAGRYQTVAVQNPAGVVYYITTDRLTGDRTMCVGKRCSRVEDDAFNLR